MPPDQILRHHTLRGIGGTASRDPDSPAYVIVHEEQPTLLRDLGLELQPAAPPVDLVSQCKQHGNAWGMWHDA